MARLQWTMRKRYKVNNHTSLGKQGSISIFNSLLSQSMKDVFISIPITSLRFISITWVSSLEPANCSAKQCQLHFKGRQSVWWYSNVVRFWGISAKNIVKWLLWSQATMTEWNLPRSASAPPNTHFFLLCSFKNCARRGLESAKSQNGNSKQEAECGLGCSSFYSSVTFKFLSGRSIQ